jgi:hypothetical protein
VELIKNYNYIIDYHIRKTNMVIDALRWKDKAMVGNLPL